MRRHLRKFLPVILTALIVQIWAPVAACWAASFAAADPLRTLEICQSNPDSAPVRSDQGGGALHGGACFICCVLHASASLDPPQVTVLVSPYLEVGYALWDDHVVRFVPARTGSNSQARAPPRAI